MTAIPLTSRGLIWANLICLISMLAWCVGLPASKFLVGDIAPIPLTALRMLVAGSVLALIWWAVEGAAPIRRANWWLGIVVGSIVMGLGGLGMVFALDLTDAVTVAIISAIMPIMGIALEVLLDGRRITATLLLGLGLGILGGVIALDVGEATPALGWGALAALISVFGYVWGSRATVKSFPGLSPLGQTAITVLGAGIAVGTLALLQTAIWGSGIDWPELGWSHVGALFFSSIVGVVLAQTLWILAVGHIGVGVASLHSNASPFYVMLIAVALGGMWNWTQALGAAIVILGVLVAQGVIRVWR